MQIVKQRKSGAVAIVSYSGDKSEQSPVNCCFSLVLPVDHALANNFDAATMSAIGTKRTSRERVPMSAFGGKADISRATPNVRF
jgi:hypothetical protein